MDLLREVRGVIAGDKLLFSMILFSVSFVTTAAILLLFGDRVSVGFSRCSSWADNLHLVKELTLSVLVTLVAEVCDIVLLLRDIVSDISKTSSEVSLALSASCEELSVCLNGSLLLNEVVSGCSTDVKS